MKIGPNCLIALAALLAGCASQANLAPEKKIIVTEDQTEVVVPVGSHMRTRVLKGQRAATISPTDSTSGERINDSLLTRDGTLPDVPVR